MGYVRQKIRQIAIMSDILNYLLVDSLQHIHTRPQLLN